MIRKLCMPGVLGFLILSLGFEPVSREFFISPVGNDANPGTKAKPFATLEKAMQEVGKTLVSDRKSGMIVWLADGKYEIRKPVVVNSADFGKGEVQVTFRAIKGSAPVISGGTTVIGWQKAGNTIWKAPVPEALKSGFRELFFGGKRAIRARFPNEGYLRVKQAGADRRTNFFFEKGDFPIPRYASDVELVLLHDWSISRIGVKQIDPGTCNLMTLDSIGAKKPEFFNIDYWEKNPRYFLENAREFLDADYEWFCDAREKMIYLKLPATENPGNLEIIAPVSEGILVLQGSERQPLKNLHFEGITFSYSAWQIPAMGYCGIQACHFDPRPRDSQWSVVPAAVTAKWIENCTFTNCRFSHLGGTGLWFGTSSKNCNVENSEFTDISGNGIMIGEGNDRKVKDDVWWKTAPNQVADDNAVINCTVTGCGKQFFGAVGIWCGLTARTTISGCEISWLPYTGISIGWEWSPQPTPCRENRITGNHIHHIMQVLSDGGGVYMLGLQPGSVISGNRIHDVEVNAGRAESNGMFLDEGITDVVVENNLIYNIARSPLRFHKATTNLVKGNYLFCKEGIPPIRYNSTKENDIKKVDNRVFSEKESNYDIELKKIISEWK